MRVSTVFDVAVAPDRVVAYLSEPRHVMGGNYEASLLERSPDPLATGSWFIYSVGQLRLRVDYTTFEPPTRIAIASAMSGRGSGGMRMAQEFRLLGLDGGLATRIEATAEGRGGLIRWEPVVRFAQNRTWRRYRQQMEAANRNDGGSA